mmetsp:Transcript_804/g.1441  ORF Transcript_804/g.1441 Transcript_804/m.1441 type:complete len:227 (-) Transcript_804:1259-1939(-)
MVVSLVTSFPSAPPSVRENSPMTSPALTSSFVPASSSSVERRHPERMTARKSGEESCFQRTVSVEHCRRSKCLKRESIVEGFALGQCTVRMCFSVALSPSLNSFFAISVELIISSLASPSSSSSRMRSSSSINASSSLWFMATPSFSCSCSVRFTVQGNPSSFPVTRHIQRSLRGFICSTSFIRANAAEESTPRTRVKSRIMKLNQLGVSSRRVLMESAKRLILAK